MLGGGRHFTTERGEGEGKKVMFNCKKGDNKRVKNAITPLPCQKQDRLGGGVSV